MKMFKRPVHSDRRVPTTWQVDKEFKEVELKASDRQIGGDHYKGMVIQVSEFNHKNGLGWCEGSIVKYVCRHNLKGGREDLEKAKHYLDLLLEWRYGEEGNQE